MASDDSDFEFVFTKRIRLRNGRILIAAHYGLEAFRIKVRKRKSE